MYGTTISKTGLKILSKQNYVALAMEPAYNEVQGRITIRSTQKDDDKNLLNHKPVSKINLNGTVHATAEAFVVAFNTMMKECCCDGSTSEATTTTTPVAETTTTTTPELM